MRKLVPVVLLSLTGCATPYPVAGLRPLYPKAGPGYPKVDSLQPTLRWESFPRPADLEADREGWLSRIANVAYDLRIWRATEEDVFLGPMAGELIYSRSALPTPTHTVETPLTARTRYLWSIRARFDLDGQLRVTEWGVLRDRGHRDPRTEQIPQLGYYHFTTP